MRFYLSIFFWVVISSLSAYNTNNQLQQDNRLENAKNCRCNNIELKGRVKVVTSGADLRIKVVDSQPDLRVKKVDRSPIECGEWQFVNSGEDFTVEFVANFPDFTIKYVEILPGMN